MKKLLILIVLFITPIDMVYAGCSDLATTFSANSKSMDIDELASLKKCVTSELKARFRSTSGGVIPRYAPMPTPGISVPAPAFQPAPSR